MLSKMMFTNASSKLSSAYTRKRNTEINIENAVKMIMLLKLR